MKELIDSTIEARIVEILRGGSINTTKLIEMIKKLRPGTPKQSVYLALRKLKKKEVVAISGKLVSLHEMWVIKMRNFFAKAGHGQSESTEINLINLEEKERVSYTFKSLLNLDMFWAHAFSSLMNGMKAEESMLVYNPHQWFLLIREKSETEIIKEAKKRKISWLQLVGRATTMDKEIRKYFDNQYTRSHLLEREIFPENYYVNCFNDLLIEVWIDEKAAEKIDQIYNKNKISVERVISELQEIIKDKNYEHKMRISRNSKKTEKIKRMFEKYFIISN